MGQIWMDWRSSICEAPIQHFLRKRRLNLFILLSLLLLFEQKETWLFFHDKESPQTIFAFMLFLKVLIEFDDILDDNVLSLLFLELLIKYGLLFVPKSILRNRQPSLQLMLHIEELGRTFSSKTSPRIDQSHFSGGYWMKRVFSSWKCTIIGIGVLCFPPFQDFHKLNGVELHFVERTEENESLV